MDAPAPKNRLADEQRNRVVANLGIAGEQAVKVWNRGHRRSDLEDLTQAAMVGLCDAARLFDAKVCPVFYVYAKQACYYAAFVESLTQGRSVIHLPAWHAQTRLTTGWTRPSCWPPSVPTTAI